MERRAGTLRPAALSCGGCTQAAPRTSLVAGYCGAISRPRSSPATAGAGAVTPQGPERLQPGTSRHRRAGPALSGRASAHSRAPAAPRGRPGQRRAGRGAVNHGPREPSLAQPALPGCSGRGRGLGPAGPRLHLPRAAPDRAGRKGMDTSQSPDQRVSAVPSQHPTARDGETRAHHSAGPGGTGSAVSGQRPTRRGQGTRRPRGRCAPL